MFDILIQQEHPIIEPILIDSFPIQRESSRSFHHADLILYYTSAPSPNDRITERHTEIGSEEESQVCCIPKGGREEIVRV